MFQTVSSSMSISMRISTNQPPSDPTHWDTYALGLTLLSAFYLSENLNLEQALQEARNNIEKWPILAIIKDMVKPI